MLTKKNTQKVIKNKLVTLFIGAEEYQIILEAIDSEDLPIKKFSSKLSRYELKKLKPGQIYEIRIKSIGINSIYNHQASEPVKVQTGMLKS